MSVCDCCGACIDAFGNFLTFKRQKDITQKSGDIAIEGNLQKKKEHYYFSRPIENKYSNEELYDMEIQEMIVGIHPTIYKKNKKSFHPFFFLQLFGDDIDDFGVIVQYIKIPDDVKDNQKHVYEEDGVEFIEKKRKDFENELRLILFNGTGIKIGSLSEWTITYRQKEFSEVMTLGDFFRKAIPVKGFYLQKELNPKVFEKTCIGFCINAIKNLNLSKKKVKSSSKRIMNLKSVLFKVCELVESETYEFYKKGLNILLGIIFE